MSEWQPIDTAPKDGASVLVAGMDNDISTGDLFIEIAEVVHPSEIEIKDGRGLVWRNGRKAWFASHWMPIPQPPEQI